ncbi:MAG TPA: DUF5666 domain-containing protein [Bryobacteraceae bacterium]|nr:DUF5666 domain-containing protein [Bryobacteraceae bacterium]
MKLLAFISLAFLTSVAAQQREAREPQTAGGTLVAMGQDFISVKLNDKLTTVHFSPDTEFWRRGIDFTAPSNLVVGDEIYVRYERTLTDGTPIATLIAAVEEGDAVRLIPHDVAEIRVCSGYLTAISTNTITIKNDEGACTVRFTPDTSFWRGDKFHDPRALVKGDQIGVRAEVNYPSGELVAADVEANVTKSMGKITKVGSRSVAIAEEDEDGRPTRRVTVFIDDHTTFDEGTPKDLQAGAFLEVIGLDLGHDRMRATKVLSLEPAR